MTYKVPNITAQEIRAAILGAFVTSWHERCLQAGNKRLPLPLSGADIKLELPLYIRQAIQGTSYSIQDDLKRYCREDPPWLYQVQSYDQEGLFVPAWADLDHYELVLSPLRYVARLVQRLLRPTSPPLSGTQLWAACQGDSHSPINNRNQLYAILQRIQGGPFRLSGLIEQEHYLYLPTRWHENHLRFLRLAWAWPRARLEHELDQLLLARHPLLQQGRLLTLQCLARDFLAALNALAPQLSSVLALQQQQLRTAITSLLDRCQRHLEALPLPVPPSLTNIPPLALLSAQDFQQLLARFDSRAKLLAGPSDLAAHVGSQMSRHYLAQQVLQEQTIAPPSDLIQYERCDAWLYVAASFGGPRTRTYAYFVRQELGWVREPALVVPLLTATDPYDRKLAVLCLAFLHPPQMSQSFWRLALHDTDAEVRWAALWALQWRHGQLSIGLSERVFRTLNPKRAELALQQYPAFHW